MSEQESFEQGEEGRDSVSSPEEIRLIKEQWIPDIEEMVLNVSDEAQRKSFEEELSQIKADFAEIENADFGDEEVIKRVKEVYERSEDLFGKVSLSFEKEEVEV